MADIEPLKEKLLGDSTRSDGFEGQGSLHIEEVEQGSAGDAVPSPAAIQARKAKGSMFDSGAAYMSKWKIGLTTVRVSVRSRASSFIKFRYP